MSEPLHRIYLPEIPWGVVHVPDGRLRMPTQTRTYYYSLGLHQTEQVIEDYSIFPYLVEELISASAISFVVPETMKAQIRNAQFLHNERLTFVDTREAWVKANAIITDINESNEPYNVFYAPAGSTEEDERRSRSVCAQRILKYRRPLATRDL
jgi:hypothetical protein